MERNYESISDTITLYIQEKFFISPEIPLHLLAGSKYQYQLLTSTHQNITLPLPHYLIKNTNKNFRATPTL
jgi:hypothetical protein